jgi:hypothetical protein
VVAVAVVLVPAALAVPVVAVLAQLAQLLPQQ